MTLSTSQFLALNMCINDMSMKTGNMMLTKIHYFMLDNIFICLLNVFDTDVCFIAARSVQRYSSTAKDVCILYLFSKRLGHIFPNRIKIYSDSLALLFSTRCSLE